MKGMNKHSIKTKIMLMTTCAILVVILASTFSGILVIRNVSNTSARQMLMLMCESGQRNLDHYFDIGEITCPTKYFPEASSINFRRSCRYGLGVLRTSMQFRLQKWHLGRFRIFGK